MMSEGNVANKPSTEEDEDCIDTRGIIRTWWEIQCRVGSDLWLTENTFAAFASLDEAKNEVKSYRAYRSNREYRIVQFITTAKLCDVPGEEKPSESKELMS